MTSKIIINSVNSELQGNYPDQLRKYLSYLSPGYKYSPRYKARQWDGRIYLLKKNIFPTGLLSKVEKFLVDNHIKYEIDDTRKFKIGDTLSLTENFKAWEHQTNALRIGLEKKNGIFAVATSGGKTNIASMLVSEIGQPTIFLTHLKGLLHQTKERFEQLLGCDVGIVGDSIFKPKRITVASIQTVLRCIEKGEIDWLQDFKVMICDEVHHLSSTSWVSVCKLIPAEWRFGLSGTVNLEGNGMLLEAYTGPILYDIKLDYLESNHLITPFSVKLIKLNGPIVTGKDYPTIYQKGIVDNESRNELIIKLTKNYAEKGLPTLVLFRYIKHGTVLSEMLNKINLPHELIYQKTSTDERIRIKNDIESGSCKILIASSIFDEGENLPSVSVLILAGGEKGGQSGRRLLQRIGRVLRLSEGKKEALIYDFFDNTNRYLRSHSEQRVQVYVDNNIKHSFIGEL